jgi:hypothetical protein
MSLIPEHRSLIPYTTNELRPPQTGGLYPQDGEWPISASTRHHDRRRRQRQRRARHHRANVEAVGWCYSGPMRQGYRHSGAGPATASSRPAPQPAGPSGGYLRHGSIGRATAQIVAQIATSVQPGNRIKPLIYSDIRHTTPDPFNYCNNICTKRT